MLDLRRHDDLSNTTLVIHVNHFFGPEVHAFPANSFRENNRIDQGTANLNAGWSGPITHGTAA
jgi:hypothetical protein